MILELHGDRLRVFFFFLEGGKGHNYSSFRKYLVVHEGKCQHLVHLMISFYMCENRGKCLFEESNCIDPCLHFSPTHC